MTDKKGTEKESSPLELSPAERTDQELVRRDKMQKLSREGIDLFPHKVDVTHAIFEIVSEYAELTHDELEERDIKVIVPGRILSIRKMGRACFFHLADSRAKLQVYLRADKIGKAKFDQFNLFFRYFSCNSFNFRGAFFRRCLDIFIIYPGPICHIHLF